MARKKSIVDIQVNDKKFKEFQAEYNKFLESLEKMPRGWDKLDKGIGKTEGTLRNTTAALLAQQAAFRSQDKEETRKSNAALKKARETRGENARVQREERERTRAADKEERERKKQVLDAERKRRAETRAILNDTKAIGKAVAQTTVNLFKWVGIGEALTGLAGFGSLWGVADLAGRATDMRRAALSLGTTAPGQEAANIFLSPFMDVNRALGGVAAAKADRSSWWAQGATGVPFAGMDPVQALLKLLTSAQGYVKRSGYQITEQDPRIRAFEAAGIDINTLRAVQGMGSRELREAVSGTAQGMKSLNQKLGPDNLIAWTHLQVALHDAGVEIEGTLIKGLLPLAKTLSQLSTAVVKAIDDFFNTHDVTEWVKEFGHGIKDVAEYISSGKFKASVTMVVTELGQVASGLKDLLTTLGFIHPSDAELDLQNNQNLLAFADKNPGYFGDRLAAVRAQAARAIAIDRANIAAGTGAALSGSVGNMQTGPAGAAPRMGMQLGLANTLIGFLKSRGVSDAAATGIAAGAFAEGGLTGRNNPNSGAFQLGQWLGPRKRGLFARYGPHPTFAQQMEYLLWELQGGDRGGKSVLASGSAQEALRNYVTRFMRPAPGYETNRDLASGSSVLPQLGRHNLQIHSTVTVHAPAGSVASVQANQLSGVQNAR